ncbi:MAG: hypothetical protein ACI4M9_08620 [Succinivibrio sp.]
MNLFKLSVLTLCFGISLCHADENISGNVSLQLQEFNQTEELNELAQGGLVLPNQPLNLSDEQRQAIRALVQSQINSYAKTGINLKSYERETLNSLLFNYGLQVLDDNQVVILDVYVPDVVYERPMLAPGVPMPDGAQVITADNLKELIAEAKAISQKEKADTRASESNSLEPANLNKSSNSVVDYGSEFNY